MDICCGIPVCKESEIEMMWNMDDGIRMMDEGRGSRVEGQGSRDG